MSDQELASSQASEVVAKLCGHFDWQLLPHADLVHEITQSDAETPDQLRRLAIGVYCAHALYPACLGRLGVAQQRRAYTELADYLHRIARRQWSWMAVDVTQETLSVIYEKAADCRAPEAFLAFCIQKLRDTAKKVLRRANREGSLDELLEADPHGEATIMTSASAEPAPDPSNKVIEDDLRGQVIEHVRAARAAPGRAGRQLEAVWLRYVQELSIEECAAQLETSTANFSVLLNRGLEKLRQEPALLDLAQALLADA